MNSLNLGDVVGLLELPGTPLGLHRDDAEVGLRGRVDGAADVVDVHGPVVELDHDLVEPAARGGGLDDLGEPAVVAAQAAEADLARLLHPLERRLDARVAQSSADLLSGHPVDVVAIDVVGAEPPQAGVQLGLEDLGGLGTWNLRWPWVLVTR